MIHQDTKFKKERFLEDIIENLNKEIKYQKQLVWIAFIFGVLSGVLAWIAFIFGLSSGVSALI